MTTKPPPDALMFRETEDGTEFFIRVVKAHRIGVFLQGGWTLLISEPQMRALDLEDTYRADLRGFNRPRLES
jgi:hypothetical protein